MSEGEWMQARRTNRSSQKPKQRAPPIHKKNVNNIPTKKHHETNTIKADKVDTDKVKANKVDSDTIKANNVDTDTVKKTEDKEPEVNKMEDNKTEDNKMEDKKPEVNNWANHLNSDGISNKRCHKFKASIDPAQIIPVMTPRPRLPRSHDINLKYDFYENKWVIEKPPPITDLDRSFAGFFNSSVYKKNRNFDDSDDSIDNQFSSDELDENYIDYFSDHNEEEIF